MFQEERLAAIMDNLRKNGKITIADICKRFGVSKDTARRDLVKLQAQNAILRTHGGAILPPPHYEVRGFEERESMDSSVKEAIGKAAVSFVNDHDHLFMDASTTVKSLANHLQARGVTVLTNSIDLADILLRSGKHDVYLPGGKLHPKYRYMFGPATLEKIKDYRVNKAIVGVSGMTEEGLFYLNEEDGIVIREMIRRSDQVIVLTDHTKFGKRLFYQVCGLDQIDVLITDRLTDETIVQTLASFNVQVITTENEVEKT